ncbi:MAG: inositol monophosphatase family protein [Actinomycetota bacterium]
MKNWESELRFAHDLADRADQISLRYFRNEELGVRFKPDGTPITQADEEIERLLRAEISSAYPDHSVFGEEEGASGSSTTTRWILDPIDGTKNYSWGIPNWATLIALEVDGEIVCGVTSAPAVGERYAAARGLGATRNEERIRVSDVDDLTKARFGFTSAADFTNHGMEETFRSLLSTVAHDRGIGDFYAHMLVAAGALDLAVEPAAAPWDIGPLMVIVEEAGGRLTDLDGRRHIYGLNCVTSNGELHETVLELIREARGRA